MPQQEPARIRSIAQQIRAYLDAHPKATDTVEGIAGWWLPQPEAGADPEWVQQALDYLVARHEVISIRSADGQVFYTRGTS
jgi:hypothetical protein